MIPDDVVKKVAMSVVNDALKEELLEYRDRRNHKFFVKQKADAALIINSIGDDAAKYIAYLELAMEKGLLRLVDVHKVKYPPAEGKVYSEMYRLSTIHPCPDLPYEQNICLETYLTDCGFHTEFNFYDNLAEDFNSFEVCALRTILKRWFVEFSEPESDAFSGNGSRIAFKSANFYGALDKVYKEDC